MMKAPYNAIHWQEHLEDRAIKKSSGLTSTQTLLQMNFFTWGKAPQALKPTAMVPCPGITEDVALKVKAYLCCTTVLGSGRRSVSDIAKQLFKKSFGELKSSKKKQVIDQQMHEWKWQNNHANLRVFSTSCLHQVLDHSSLWPLPCSECGIVLYSKPFKNIIQKPIPQNENYAYINHRFRNPLLGELYASTIGLRDLIENEVSLCSCLSLLLFSSCSHIECTFKHFHSICSRCTEWKIRQ